jgi:hypothetical protein
MYFNGRKSILYFLVLCIFIGCQSGYTPEYIPEEEIPEEEMPEEGISIRTQAEINAAVLEVLKKHAPEVVDMEQGLAQVIALMDTIHNATQNKRDPRGDNLQPDALLTLVFTDPEYGMECGQFSMAMLDSLMALGYKVRMIQFLNDGSDEPETENHAANEVMIDEKMYAIDAAFNVMFKDDEGNFLSYKEVKDRVISGNALIIEYTGTTHFPVEDYYTPYENYFKQYVRALPFGYRLLYVLNIRVDGEEFL